MFEGSAFIASPTSPLATRASVAMRPAAAASASPRLGSASGTQSAAQPRVASTTTTRVDVRNSNHANTDAATAPTTSALLSAFHFPVSVSSSSRGDSFSPSSAANPAAEDPVREVFTVPPPLVICLVQHRDREMRPVATPACVEKCVQELQDYFSPSIAAKQVCGASSSPAAAAATGTPSASAVARNTQGAPRVGQGSHPGSRLQLQFGKAQNMYANAGAAVLNVLIYSVDEALSRPRVLAQIAKEWRDELAKTGGESSCLVFLHHKEIVAAATATQQLSRDSVKTDPRRVQQNAKKLTATSLTTATATLEEYYKELRQLKFSAHQMCAYTPNEAPMRVLERLHSACEEKMVRLRGVYEQYLVRKRTMPRRPAATTATADPTTSSPSQSTYWSVQQLWRYAQDLAQHCLQFGLVKDARTIYERAFLVYYNSSDDFAFADSLPTLEALGKTPDLFDVRHRAGAQLTDSGYPLALTAKAEVADGLLYIVACAMQCCLLDRNVQAAQRHFDLLIEIVEEKFEESRAARQKTSASSSSSGAMGLSSLSVHQHFFCLQLYLSATRSLWSSYGFSAVTQDWQHITLNPAVTASSVPRSPTPPVSKAALNELPSTREGSCHSEDEKDKSDERASLSAELIDEPIALGEGGAAATPDAEITHADLARLRAITPPPVPLMLVGQDAAEAAAAVCVAVSRATLCSPSSPTSGARVASDAASTGLTSPTADLRCSIIVPPAGYVPPPPTPPAHRTESKTEVTATAATTSPRDAQEGQPNRAEVPEMTPARRLSLFVERMAMRDDAETALSCAPHHLRTAWRRMRHQYQRLQDEQQQQPSSSPCRAPFNTTGALGQNAVSLLVSSNRRRSCGTPPIEESVFLAITYLVALGQELGLVPLGVIPALPALFDAAAPASAASSPTDSWAALEAARKTLQQNCQHLSKLILGARTCVAYLTHALGYATESSVFAEAGFLARQCQDRLGGPEAVEVAGIRQTEEMHDGASMRALWQRLTLLSAASLSVAGARRRELYLYAQLALSCIDEDPKKAATLTMRRLLPCVRDVGWTVLEYTVRRLYVECLARLRRGASSSSSAGLNMSSDTYRYLYSTDAAYALYKECVLYLVSVDGNSVDANGETKRAALSMTHGHTGALPDGAAIGGVYGACDVEALVACALKLSVHTREQWWCQMRKVDHWMARLFLKPTGPLCYRLSTLLRAPRITATVIAREAQTQRRTEDAEDEKTRASSPSIPIVSLAGRVRIVLEGFCPIDPLMPVAHEHAESAADADSDHDAESAADGGAFLLTLESRKDWMDAAEPTHVIRLSFERKTTVASSLTGDSEQGEGASYTYDASTGVLCVAFLFTACHAGAYRVRCVELRVGASWFSLYPREANREVLPLGQPPHQSSFSPAGMESSSSSLNDFEHEATPGFDAENEESLVARRQRLEEEFTACQTALTSDTDTAVDCPDVVFRVREPESNVRLRVLPSQTILKEHHLFADATDYVTVIVETDEQLMPPVAVTASATHTKSAAKDSGERTSREGGSTVDVIGVNARPGAALSAATPSSASARPLTPAQREAQVHRALRQQHHHHQQQQQPVAGRPCVFEAPIAMVSVSPLNETFPTGASLARSSAAAMMAPSLSPASAGLDTSFVAQTASMSFANFPWAASVPLASSDAWVPSGSLPSVGESRNKATASELGPDGSATATASATLGFLTVRAGVSGSGGRARSRSGGLRVQSMSSAVRAYGARSTGVPPQQPHPSRGASLSAIPVPGLSMHIGEGVRVDYAATGTSISPASNSLSVSTVAPGRRRTVSPLLLRSPDDTDALDSSRASRSGYIHYHRIAAGLPDGGQSLVQTRPYAQPQPQHHSLRREEATPSTSACVAHEQMRITVVDEVETVAEVPGERYGATSTVGSASTVIPFNEQQLLGTLPVPTMTSTCVAPSSLALKSWALVPAQKQCVFQLTRESGSDGSGDDLNDSEDTRLLRVAGSAVSHSPRTPATYTLRIPLLPILVSRLSRRATKEGEGTAATASAGKSAKSTAAENVSVCFTCWRGAESTTTSAALSLPFRSAIDTTYDFKHLQGHVYCLVTMRNVLAESSLWLRGVQLHVLDASPTYEVVRVSNVYERLLTTEWKPGEAFQLLFELSLCATYQGTEAIRQHRVQLRAFYSSWSRTYLTTAEKDRTTLRLMGTLSTEEGAESVCVEDSGTPLMPESSHVPTQRQPQQQQDQVEQRTAGVFTPLRTTAFGDSSASYSITDQPRAASEAAHDAAHGQSDPLIGLTSADGAAKPSQTIRSRTGPCTSDNENEPSSHTGDDETQSSDLGRTGIGGRQTRSAALRYNPVTASLLAASCNTYCAPVATFASKHMCLFSAVMYAESPWTQRFGATMNYTHRRTHLTSTSAHGRSGPVDSKASRAAMTDTSSGVDGELLGSFVSVPGTALAGGAGVEDNALLSDAMVDAPADLAFVAGEPVRFCVRLEPHAQNWPEDAGLEEDFIIDFQYDPHEWMVIGKKRERRTLSLMEEVTVTFTAVPLLPPSSPAAAQALARMSGTNAVDGAAVERPITTPVKAPFAQGAKTAALAKESAASTAPVEAALRPAGSAVVDEGVIRTPTVEMYWADRTIPVSPQVSRAPSPLCTTMGNPHTAVRSDWSQLAGSASRSAAAQSATATGEARSRGGEESRGKTRNALVLFDLVQFRTHVRVCKRSATIRRGGGTDRPLAPNSTVTLAGSVNRTRDTPTKEPVSKP